MSIEQHFRPSAWSHYVRWKDEVVRTRPNNRHVILACSVLAFATALMAGLLYARSVRWPVEVVLTCTSGSARLNLSEHPGRTISILLPDRSIQVYARLGNVWNAYPVPEADALCTPNSVSGHVWIVPDA